VSALALDDIVSTLKKTSAENAAMFGIEAYGIVGSFARGCATDQSDIDIASRVVGSPTLFDVSRMTRVLAAELGRDVDLVFPEDMPEYKREHIMRDYVAL
jgi:predicted nucleotidyltransferase